MDLVRFDALRVPVRKSGFDRVDKVIGASMLVSDDVLRDVGLIDERFFLYWEDTDYCFRAREKGYGVAVSYDARVRHKRHGTSNERVRGYFMSRNALLFMATHLPPGRRLVPGFLFLARGAKDVAKYSLWRRDRARARAIALGLLDGLRGRTGKGRLDEFYG
jgi:GT2 family glycosyltransferase